jgi:hypothetical protein
MKAKLMIFAASMTLSAGTLPSTASAQQDDLAKRIQAMEECNVDGWLGYGSYEICVEQRYYDLIHYPDSGGGGGYDINRDLFDPTKCNTAGTRLCPR